jgi:iron complex outermembrane receptor protein
MASSSKAYLCAFAALSVFCATEAHAQTAPVEQSAAPGAPNAEPAPGASRLPSAGRTPQAAGSAATAQAVSPTNGGVAVLQDIVVTARRTSESLQKTPIAITALNAQAIEKMNVQQVDKVAQIAPNLVISQQSSALSAASVNIRGIGQTDPSLALDAAVGIYLDGVYVARAAGAIFDLVDLERIEVLRGPQGTLFGRNTTGGAIQLVSKKPSDDFGVTAKGGYGSRDNWFTRLRVDTGRIANTPISASLSYYHRERNGYFDNTLAPSDQDPGSLDVNALAGALRGDFDKLQVNYSFDYDHRTGAPGFFQTVGLTPTALAYYGESAALGGAPLQFVGADQRLESGQQQPGHDGVFTSLTESRGHSLTVSYEVSPALTFKSITGYRTLYLNNVLGLSGQGDLKGRVVDFTSPTLYSIQSVTPYNGYNGPQRQHQFSEEFQVLGKWGELSYVGGVYWFKEDATEDNHQDLTIVVPSAGLSFLGFPAEVGQALEAQGVSTIGINTSPEARYQAHANSKAIFGQVSWKPGYFDEKLEVTGGLRYTEDHKALTLDNSTNGVPDLTNGSGEVDFHNMSWLGSLSYQITPSKLVYAKISTGYKSGGFNPRAPGLTDANGNFAGLNSFRPEKLTSYEAGFKVDLFEHRLRVNGAGFFSEYDDLQVPQFAAGSAGASTLLVNAGKAEFKGFELEMTALPMHGLTLSGSVGYTDPEYKQFLFRNPNTNLISDIADTARFPNVAKWNSFVSAEYDFDPMSFGQIQARISYAYRSKVYFYPNDEVNPFQEAVASPATNTLSARLALTDIPISDRAKGEIALVGENLLDENQVLYGIDFGSLGFAGKFYSEPRFIGVEGKITFQ